MKDIRVDAEGEFRCWNCGNKGLLEKRTFRSKMLVGVGSMLTKKKLKCQTCGEYNDTGNAKPYDGPASRKWRKRWQAIEDAKSSAEREAESRQAKTNANALTEAMLTAASQMRPNHQSELTDGYPVAESLPAGSSEPPPPGWAPDPAGRHELRYWDGGTWSDHVSDRGVQAIDHLSG
ncbi:MAG: DUF2510 domain-containing protein [Acidimicrobiales bacterium]